jgi:uncharacterized protein YbbC (DUF1343 family)
LFAPEHGYFGLGGAGEKMADDRLGALPIHSLHGERFAPSAESLRGLDALLIDLQDTGNRWYTFLATAHNALIACAALKLPVLILDRPNPQGGLCAEGLLAEDFSLVAPFAIPARYGLTIGEGLRWISRTAPHLDAVLSVIPMQGWRRDQLFADTGLRWESPSPNMPHPTTALLYSGTCLIEGTNISEGRGTALPFEQIGAPFIEAERLSAHLNALTLPGITFAPAWFRPTVSKFAGERCEGVRLHVSDPGALRGFTIGLYLIEALRTLYGERVAFNSFFDVLAATPRLREAITRGESTASIAAWCAAEADAFHAASRAIWLYP